MLLSNLSSILKDKEEDLALTSHLICERLLGGYQLIEVSSSFFPLSALAAVIKLEAARLMGLKDVKLPLMS